VWDLESGREIHTLAGHRWVHSVVVTPDGKRVISGSYDNLKVWNLESGKIIAEISFDSVVTYNYSNVLDSLIAADTFGHIYILRLDGLKK
jgi:WD40 repeat protein